MGSWTVYFVWFRNQNCLQPISLHLHDHSLNNYNTVVLRGRGHATERNDPSEVKLAVQTIAVALSVILFYYSQTTPQPHAAILTSRLAQGGSHYHIALGYEDVCKW